MLDVRMTDFPTYLQNEQMPLHVQCARGLCHGWCEYGNFQRGFSLELRFVQTDKCQNLFQLQVDIWM